MFQIQLVDDDTSVLLRSIMFLPKQWIAKADLWGIAGSLQGVRESIRTKHEPNVEPDRVFGLAISQSCKRVPTSHSMTQYNKDENVSTFLCGATAQSGPRPSHG